MPPTTRTLALVLCLLLLGGCAALPPGKRDPRDPWERVNRTTYKFNDKFDRAIARPVARAYRKTPQFVQTGVHNFFTNLDYTVVMLNDLLQGQFKPFARDTARLVINTTVGIGGLFDPASKVGLDRNDRDLGQTFGKWGMKTGPYLVIPFLGPSDVRDAFGRLGDDFSSPRQYIRNPYWNYGLFLLQTIDSRARLLDASAIADSAFDPYAFIRNAYLQNREFKVHGAQPENEEQEEKLLEQAGDDQSSPENPPKPQSPQQPQSQQPQQAPSQQPQQPQQQQQPQQPRSQQPQ
jgi:phospholipid-binding lipoprotein MlaA